MTRQGTDQAGTALPSTIAEALAADSSIRFALLFGSRATGNARPDSDWDIAVYFDDAVSAEQRFAARLRLAAAHDACDIVVLNEAPALLGHAALQGRLVLMRDRRTYNQFFVQTLARSNDERYWRRFHAAARRRRLEEGSFGRP